MIGMRMHLLTKYMYILRYINLQMNTFDAEMEQH